MCRRARQLERRRRQQRLSRQADGDGFRRHDLDRGRDLPQEGGIRRHRDPRPAARATTASRVAEPSRRSFGAVIPKGAKNVAVAKEFLKYVDPAEGAERVPEGRARPLALPRSRNSPRATRSGSTRIRIGRLTPSRACSARRSRIYEVYNPAMAEVSAEHVLSVADARRHEQRDDAGSRRSTRRSSGSRRSSRNIRSSRAERRS